MPTILIQLDGQPVDYEDSESLDLSLVKRTDRITEVVGADGVELDNPLESITLPATTGNHAIYDQIALLHPAVGIALSKVTRAFADGTIFFAGSSILRKASVKRNPSKLVLEMLGDGLSVWNQLEGVSLRDLDLGTYQWDTSSITTSWVASPPGIQGIFAPVVYGKTTGDAAPGAWHERDLRLHVYFLNIVKGIFEGLLGYTVVSEFMETLWFGRWVYLFGVGDMVRYEHLPTATSVHVYRIPGVAGSSDPILYHLEYEDTRSEWDEVGQTTLTANPDTSPDDYTLEFTGQGTNWGTFEVEINGVVVYSTGPSYTVGGAQYFQVIKTFSLATGDDLTTHAYDDGLGTLALYDLHLRIYTTPKPWQGADVVVSSCLHDEPVKKFLRAITQMFCLAWRFNTVTKQCFVEPRFPYRLYSSGSHTDYPGFYRTPDSSTALRQVSAENYDVDFLSPFGRELVLCWDEDTSNPLFEVYNAANENTGVPMFGIKKPFEESDPQTTTEPNELFVPLLLSTPDAAHASGGYLPTILPDSYDITEENLPAAEKTFKGKPTCGMVFRDAVEAIWNDTGLEETMPLISQYKPYRVDGDHDDELNIGTFCNGTAQPVEDGQVAQDVYGLAHTFYLHYFRVMKPAMLVRCEQPISLERFSTEDFRNLNLLDLGEGYDQVMGILVEIAKFNPITMTPMEMLFLKWSQPTALDAADITHNPITIAPPKPTGICCEASATVAKVGSDADITSTACREILNVEVLVDDVRVYSGDLTAGTFGDATVDGDGKITVDSAAIGTGVITFTVNIKQDGCEVRQSVRVIEF